MLETKKYCNEVKGTSQASSLSISWDFCKCPTTFCLFILSHMIFILSRTMFETLDDGVWNPHPSHMIVSSMMTSQAQLRSWDRAILARFRSSSKPTLTILAHQFCYSPRFVVTFFQFLIVSHVRVYAQVSPDHHGRQLTFPVTLRLSPDHRIWVYNHVASFVIASSFLSH